MEQPCFLITPEEAESTAKRFGVSVLQLLPLLVDPAKSLARPPISKFRVAAVGLGSSGRIFLGVNVEFPGLPLHHSIHAEQFLITNLTLNSEPNLRYFSVSAAPCGHCRQFLQEIRDAPDTRILITDPNAFRDASTEENGVDGDGDGFVRLESILPHRFGPHDLLEKDVPLLLEPHDNHLTLADPDLQNGHTDLDLHNGHTDPDLPNGHTDLDIPNGHTDFDHYSNLKHTALSAANRSYSPYSQCPSGVALVDSEGKVYRGWYMESAAYNPSLGPVQAALVDFVANGGGGGFERIVGGVLVEKKDAVVRQEDTARMLLQTIAPKCDFKVFHCYGY